MTTQKEWENIGMIAVDAGMVMVGDPGYTLPNDGSNRTDIGGGDWPTFVDLISPGLDTLGHATVCENAGIVVSSGYGDGYYPVLIQRDENGRVKSLRIDFIE